MAGRRERQARKRERRKRETQNNIDERQDGHERQKIKGKDERRSREGAVESRDALPLNHQAHMKKGSEQGHAAREPLRQRSRLTLAVDGIVCHRSESRNNEKGLTQSVTESTMVISRRDDSSRPWKEPQFGQELLSGASGSDRVRAKLQKRVEVHTGASAPRERSSKEAVGAQRRCLQKRIPFRFGQRS